MSAILTRLPTADLAVIGAYLLIVVLVGLVAGRRGRDPEGYMVAGRDLPGWAVGLSIFGTCAGGIGFLALPAGAFAGDWSAFVLTLPLPLIAGLAVWFFVPFHLGSGGISAYEHFEWHFGSWARMYAVGAYLLTQAGFTGAALYLAGLALAPLTGWSVSSLVLAAGGAVLAYALIGGMPSVAWTQSVQGVVMIVGALAGACILLAGMPEGPGQLFEIATRHEKFALGGLVPTAGIAPFWVMLSYGACIHLQAFGIDQGLVQRYRAARSGSAAGGVWLGALLSVAFTAILLLVGTALFAFYNAHPNLLPATVDTVHRPDAVFPCFVATRLHPGIAGLLIAAILAAAQSGVASAINCSSTVFLCDVYRRFFRPRASAREAMRVLRLATLAFGALGVGIALAMIRIQPTLELTREVVGAASSGILGLFLLAILFRRISSAAAAPALLGGILLILWMTFARKIPALTQCAGAHFPGDPRLIVVLGTAAILAIGVVLCFALFLCRRAANARPGRGSSFTD